MSKGDDKKIITAANRATALIVLAAKGQKAAGDCLSSDVMAALVAGNLGEGERQHCLDHLAGCQCCYDEWRALASDERAASVKIVKGSWFSKRSFSFTAAGSLLAAAASLILYLNLTPPSVMESPAPVPQVMESYSPADVVSDELQPLKKEVSPPPRLQKASRSKSRRLASQQAKERESMADGDIDMQASVKSGERASRRRLRAVDNFAEEKAMEADFAALLEEDEGEDMVDIGNVIPLVLKKMAQLAEGESLVLQSFKRDRSLTLIRLADERILIREEGFDQGEFEVAGVDLKKALKPLLEKEFPRSNKVRILSGGKAGQ